MDNCEDEKQTEGDGGLEDEPVGGEERRGRVAPPLRPAASCSPPAPPPRPPAASLLQFF